MSEAAARIRAMLDQRGAAKTLCPSEVARVLTGPGGDWRGRMTEVHDAVDALLADGMVVLSWQGRQLSSRDGPYRIGTPA